MESWDNRTYGASRSWFREAEQLAKPTRFREAKWFCSATQIQVLKEVPVSKYFCEAK